MTEKTFDLDTRVENKPADCGKRISYNEITFGCDYYVLYNGALHKVTVRALTTDNGAAALKVSYLNDEEEYLGDLHEENGEKFHIINLDRYFPRFYETRF